MPSAATMRRLPLSRRQSGFRVKRLRRIFPAPGMPVECRGHRPGTHLQLRSAFKLAEVMAFEPAVQERNMVNTGAVCFRKIGALSPKAESVLRAATGAASAHLKIVCTCNIAMFRQLSTCQQLFASAFAVRTALRATTELCRPAEGACSERACKAVACPRIAARHGSGGFAGALFANRRCGPPLKRGILLFRQGSFCEKSVLLRGRSFRKKRSFTKQTGKRTFFAQSLGRQAAGLRRPRPSAPGVSGGACPASGRREQ